MEYVICYCRSVDFDHKSPLAGEFWPCFYTRKVSEHWYLFPHLQKATAATLTEWNSLGYRPRDRTYLAH